MMSCSHVVENLFRTLEKGLGFALPNLTFLITKNVLSCVELLSRDLYCKGVCNILHLPVCASLYADCTMLARKTEESCCNSRQGQQAGIYF